MRSGDGKVRHTHLADTDQTYACHCEILTTGDTTELGIVPYRHRIGAAKAGTGGQESSPGCER